MAGPPKAVSTMRNKGKKIREIEGESKDIGDLSACRLDNPAERLSRDVHPGRRLFLVQPFEVGKAYRLILIEGQKHFPAVQRWSSLGMETGFPGHVTDPSAALRSWHPPLLVSAL